MNQRHEQDDDTSSPRRRRLDELFADQPFLSPTMKARRLHEKLYEQSAEDASRQASPETQGLPSEAYVRSVADCFDRLERTDTCNAPYSRCQDKAASPVTLIDAAIYLRSKGSQTPRTVSVGAQERLTAFRDSALKMWVIAVENEM